MDYVQPSAVCRTTHQRRSPPMCLSLLDFGLGAFFCLAADGIYRRTQKHVIPPVAGPIASDISSIELYMDALLASEPWNRDPQLLPIPWRQELTIPPRRPLRLAFVHDDGVIKPQPPIERAVRETAANLAQAGHIGIRQS
jgi:Asp-tRNA(Asn)/Glu-tRNA(Gln) amidotransferase A subunit family amidase